MFLSAETLTAIHVCMTHARVYSMPHCVCLFNIGSTYPTPEHGYGGMVLFSLESVHNL